MLCTIGRSVRGYPEFVRSWIFPFCRCQQRVLLFGRESGRLGERRIEGQRIGGFGRGQIALDSFSA